MTRGTFTTRAAQSAFNHIDSMKHLVTEKAFEHMVKAIELFDVSCMGFGFDAMQAQQKLKGMLDLTENDMKGVTFLFD